MDLASFIVLAGGRSQLQLLLEYHGLDDLGGGATSFQIVIEVMFIDQVLDEPGEDQDDGPSHDHGVGVIFVVLADEESDDLLEDVWLEQVAQALEALRSH